MSIGGGSPRSKPTTSSGSASAIPGVRLDPSPWPARRTAWGESLAILASLAAAFAVLVLLGVALLVIQQGAGTLTGQLHSWQTQHFQSEQAMIQHATSLRASAR